MTTSPDDNAPLIATEGDWTVLRFGPGMAQIVESNVEQARDYLMQGAEAAKQAPPPKLLLDLSGVGFFGSSFIEGLFRCWKAMQAADGEFAISNCSEHCREVLTVTHLADLWTIYGDNAEATGA